MSMFNKVSKSFMFGQHEVTLTTGEIARQASGAVVVQMGDTVILATVVAKKETKPGQDFFPLTVDYIEKAYAAGKFPGGFFKREGRPSEHETLTSRLIDRPIRPLFPDGFFNEVQVIIHVLSVDPEINPDIPSMIGASAALTISGIPFKGPIGACRVGYVNGGFVCNPTVSQLKESRLDLVVAGTERAVLMVESEADCLPEQTMLDAVMFGHQQMQVAINAIHELTAEAGKPAWDWQPAPKNEALIARVHEIAQADIEEAYTIRSKQSRTEKLRAIYEKVEAQLTADAEAAGTEVADMNEVHGILLKWKPTSFAPTFSKASLVLTVATRARFVRSKSGSRSFRVLTVPPSLPAAKRRLWCSPRSAPSRMNRSSTTSWAKAAIGSSCTTTCLRLPPVKPVAWAARSVAKSATVVSPNVL